MNQTCKFCGTPLEGYETFCPGCGRELTDDTSAGFRPDAAEDTYAPIEAPTPRRAAPRSPVRMPEPDELFDPIPEETLFDPHPEKDSSHRPVQRPARRPQNAQRRPVQRQSSRPQPKNQQRRPAKRRRSGWPYDPVSPRMRLPLLIGLAAVAILLAGFGMKLFSGAGNEQRTVYPFTPVIDQYFESVRTGNANKFVATRPAEYTAYLTSGAGSAYDSESEYRAETAATLQKRLGEYQAQYGNIRSVKYELTDVRSYIHRCEALSEVLTGWYAFPENAVSDAYIVSGEYTVTGTNGSGEYPITEMLLIRMGDNWYFSPDAGSYWRAE